MPPTKDTMPNPTTIPTPAQTLTGTGPLPKLPAVDKSPAVTPPPPPASTRTVKTSPVNQNQKMLHDKLRGAVKTDPLAMQKPEDVRKAAQDMKADVSAHPGVADGTIPPDAPPATKDAAQSYLDQMQKELDKAPTDTQTMTEYVQGLLDKSGITEDQKKVVSLDTIINGTPDDIRKELTKAGAPISDSAIAFLSDQRDKLLIQQRDALNAAIAAKEKYVDTMVSAGQYDRTEAEKKVESKLGLLEKAANVQSMIENRGVALQEKIQNDARNRVQTLITSGGITKLSDAQIRQLEVDAGFQPGDLKAAQQGVLQKDSMAQQRINISLAGLGIREQSAGGNVKLTEADLKSMGLPQSMLGQSVDLNSSSPPTTFGQSLTEQAAKDGKPAPKPSDIQTQWDNLRFSVPTAASTGALSKGTLAKLASAGIDNSTAQWIADQLATGGVTDDELAQGLVDAGHTDPNGQMTPEAYAKSLVQKYHTYQQIGVTF